jgi:hypothetical protein
MLETAPELEAKALFEHLGEQAEGGLEEKVLRTFQRLPLGPQLPQRPSG